MESDASPPPDPATSSPPTTSPLPPPPSSSGTTDDTQGESSESGDTGPVGFIMSPDVNMLPWCDPFAQDCPVGEKCMWYANDGGTAWNATACFPVVDNPADVGEPCTVEDSTASGIDTCDVGLMCWDVDPDTLEGTCNPYCTGSEAWPMCDDSDYTCSISGSGFALCLLTCDPLAQDCAGGQGCYGINGEFLCAPEWAKAGGAGDGCSYINGCVAGLACIGTDVLADCEDDVGCCSPYCALDGTFDCGEGQECLPWFDEGQAPPDYENVGVCGVP